MTTTPEIQRLRAFAEEHGDHKLAAVCMRALGDDGRDAEPGTALAECALTADEARAECERAIEVVDVRGAFLR